MYTPECSGACRVGPIPRQRETAGHPSSSPARPFGVRAAANTSLPGNPLAAGAARRFVRAALAGWREHDLLAADRISERLVDDAVVVVSELVTNAVVHAGTPVDVDCRLEPPSDDPEPPADDAAALVIEVRDHHPARAVRGQAAVPEPFAAPEPSAATADHGRGLHLVACLSEAWGITYRTGSKTVWARLPVDGTPAARQIESYAGEQALARGCGSWSTGIPDPAPGADSAPRPDTAPRLDTAPSGWGDSAALTFLAEASDLLAGQLDEELVAVLAGQLLVPRLADWCAVWLDDDSARAGITSAGPTRQPRLARVWHGSESRIEELSRALDKDPPHLTGPPHAGSIPVPWPAYGTGEPTGTALLSPLVAGGRRLGTLLIGRTGLARFPDEDTALLEDFSRRVALAIGAARQYTRQATISRVLQRGLLPSAVAEVPGIETAVVYEPRDKGLAGGDFYDIFPAGDGRWCFALGDVCGSGPEAAVVTGLARPWLRLLAREGYRAADVMDRLNELLLDDALEATESAARAVAAAGIEGLHDDGSPTRFLSLLYGELVPSDDGVRCTLASAGHPLPLLLGPGGGVRAVAEPQVLLGVLEDAAYTSESFVLAPGETLLCVTDGVTERRSGRRQFDDGDGLVTALGGCAGLSAPLVAERIRSLVYEFSDEPPDDDLALLVLRAR
ncbi:SpoIIE family protein phosphatase [Streptomyces sp. E11-3]|uniref:SpoIIE family protein phosphatase n=1 Tax=Streptomyces sp. E11-3 TaxID=3110112 RepID=UPI0039817849